MKNYLTVLFLLYQSVMAGKPTMLYEEVVFIKVSHAMLQERDEKVMDKQSIV